MRKIVLTFGLIAGAILSVMMVASTSLMGRIGFDTGAIIGYTTMVVAFLMVFFGVRAFREQVAGGHVTFGQAFTVGILITAVASVCYVATWEVIYYGLWPDFGDRYAAHVMEKARASGATALEIAEKQQQMDRFKEMYRNPLVNVALTFLEPLPVGLVITLVTAGVLRRKRNGASPAAPMHA